MLKDCISSNDGIKELKVQSFDSSQDNHYDNDSIEDELINSLHVLYIGNSA
jgi:hypothetical protein